MTQPNHSQVAVGGRSIHVVEVGDPHAPPMLLLHGWPESWRAWLPILEIPQDQFRVIAIDMPGIGRSVGAAASGAKSDVAAVIRELVETMDLRDLTLVGCDLGGMVTYAYLRQQPDLARAVIMNTVLPGLDPWDEVLRNPYVWHFAFHAIPELPERLIQGHQDEYFAYFYGVLAADPARITAEVRSAFAEAYASDEALTVGLDWYRGLFEDARRNAGDTDPVETPVLYLRGEQEYGDLSVYAAGLRAAGLKQVETASVAGAGHFASVEAPEQTWEQLARFAVTRQ